MTPREKIALLDSLTVSKVSDYGSHRWAALLRADDRRSVVDFPFWVEHPELGAIMTTVRFFQRKRDVLEAMKQLRVTLTSELSR